MSSGFGGGGGYSLYRLDEFPSDEITSLVRVVLPFGLPGLNGSYEVMTARGLWKVSANTHRIPPKAIEPHLDGYTLSVDEDGWVTHVQQGSSRQNAPKQKIVSLEPDRWGRSWRSELYMSLKGVLHPGGNDRGTEEMSTAVLEPCCVCINRILDAIVYVGGPAWLPPITPADFWFVEVDYLYGSRRIGYFKASGLQTFWWRGPRPFDISTQDALRELLRSEAFLPLHEELVVAALRKKEQGDFRGAVIDAICAVESVLAPFIETMLKARGVSKSKIDSVVGPSGLGLADQVYVLLPLLQREQLSETLRRDFAEANGKRNRIVHRGEGATGVEATKHLDTCRQIVDHLVQNTRDPPCRDP